MADRFEGLRAKHAKKVSGSLWNSTNTAHAHLSNLPNNNSDWSVSKYSMKHNRHAALCTAPIAQRTVPRCMNPDALERDSTHVYLCAHF